MDRIRSPLASNLLSLEENLDISPSKPEESKMSLMDFEEEVKLFRRSVGLSYAAYKYSLGIYSRRGKRLNFPFSRAKMNLKKNITFSRKLSHLLKVQQFNSFYRSSEWINGGEVKNLRSKINQMKQYLEIYIGLPRQRDIQGLYAVNSSSSLTLMSLVKQQMDNPHPDSGGEELTDAKAIHLSCALSEEYGK